MLKAIIFDCYGVLATDGWLPYKRKYFGHSAELFNKATILNNKVNQGLVTYDEFIEQSARLANLDKEQARLAMDQNIPNSDLLDYIDRYIKPILKLGILSNAANNRLSEILGPDNLSMFDAVALSFEIKTYKPQEKAYLTVSDLLAVRPDECLFIDDQIQNCQGATLVGMSTICYQDFPSLKNSLKYLLPGITTP